MSTRKYARLHIIHFFQELSKKTYLNVNNHSPVFLYFVNTIFCCLSKRIIIQSTFISKLYQAKVLPYIYLLCFHIKL